ncbi:unnamed protein product [Adineta steineri]|uniref:Major facilitator superfamily (MFS) profile domain-containing protein n=1 Tax=Adineta steineri TaxID=433720 RepID=A0A815DNS7_9BILA|nr:unnamed protein product [Adineta steineri]CAF1302966.1 unnamed protein product [Adineta steineri]CAF1304005.1 unnamed protein product [Adineta steineri]
MTPMVIDQKQTQVNNSNILNDTKQDLLTVYDIYTKFKKNIILFIVSGLGFLSNFNELVYVPALPMIVQDLHTTETLGLLTVSVYVLGSCFGGLIWGMLSDYYGRRSIMLLGLCGFLLSVGGSYFLSNIYIFLVFRVLQGVFICVPLIVGQATIADIYQPNQRGRAIAFFYAFYCTGSIVGPIIGGQLSYHFALGYMSMNVAHVYFSTELSKAPYDYKSNIMGILYLPGSIAEFSGSIIGGILSDYAAVRYMETLGIDEGHVVPALLFSVLTPIGLIVYGWSFQYGVHVSLPVMGSVICYFGQTGTRPGIYSFYTIKYQQHSASVIAANNFVQLLLTSIMLTFTAIIVESIGNGLYFTTMAVGNILATIVPAIIISRKIRLSSDICEKIPSQSTPLISTDATQYHE